MKALALPARTTTPPVAAHAPQATIGRLCGPEAAERRQHDGPDRRAPATNVSGVMPSP